MENGDTLIFLDGTHCKCECGDLVLHKRSGQKDRELRVVNTHGRPKDGKAPLWWIRHCESYGDTFTKIQQ